MWDGYAIVVVVLDVMWDVDPVLLERRHPGIWEVVCKLEAWPDIVEGHL
jgi:hypothetical protein